MLLTPLLASLLSFAPADTPDEPQPASANVSATSSADAACVEDFMGSSANTGLTTPPGEHRDPRRRPQVEGRHATSQSPDLPSFSPSSPFSSLSLNDQFES